MKSSVSIIMIAFLISLSFVSGDDVIIAYNHFEDIIPEVQRTCSGARFCGIDDLACKPYVSDGVCPENYGDWDSCFSNNWEKKCTPCDPDCGDCGNNVELTYDNIAYPGGALSISAKAYGYPRGKFILYRINDMGELVLIDRQRNIASCPQEGGVSTCSFNSRYLIRDVVGCQQYQFAALFFVDIDGEEEALDLVLGDIKMIGPGVTIVDPQENSEINENYNVISNVECTSGDVLRVLFYACENNDLNLENCERFSDVVHNDYEDGDFSSNLNTLQYPNGEYAMRTVAIARTFDDNNAPINSEGVGSSEGITINNEGIGGNYQGSKLLNIILARIKTWL